MLKIVFCFIQIFLLVGCSCTQREEEILLEGESTLLLNAQGTLESYTSNQLLYAAFGKIYESVFFKIEKDGAALAKKGIIEYRLEIEHRLIKEELYFFTESISTSAFVKVHHQALTKDEKLLYRDSLKEKPAFISGDSYVEEYGLLPNKTNYLGFIINDDTILSTEIISKSEESVKIKYSLDPVKSPSYLQRQMKTFGGLSGFPTFESVHITIHFNQNLYPTSFLSEEVYRIQIPILGQMQCTQSLSGTFYFQSFSIPNHQDFLDILKEA